jgi:predicted HTH domain antitoxin
MTPPAIPLRDLPIPTPSRMDITQARFLYASGLICRGGGIVSVDEAAAIAGMERRAFIQAMIDQGSAMEEAIEDALDVDLYFEAKEEAARSGEKPVSLDEALQKLGLDRNDL